MKILYVCHDHFLISGANLSMLDMLKDYDPKTCKITILLPKSNDEFEKQLNKLGIKTLVYNFTFPVGRVEKGFNYFVRIIKNRFKHLKEKLFRKKRVNDVIKLLNGEHFDVVISNSFATLFGYYIARQLGVKHCFYVREFMKEDHKIYHLYDVRKICKNSYAIFISKAIQEFYDKKYQFIKTIQIYDKINLELNSDKLKNIDQNNVKICMVGSLNPGKGQEDVIKAVSILEKENYNITLDIYGTGYMLDQYINLATELKLKDCNFCGRVSDMNQRYKNYDISTICSKQEALGRVTVESLASGLFVIGTNSGETRHLLAENRGLLYSYGNGEELAEKIKLIINTSGSDIDRKANIKCN